MKKSIRVILALAFCALPAYATTSESTNVQQAITTSALVKAVNGEFFGYAVYNPNAAAVWVEWYNTKTAPTLGSTTNLLFQVAVPAGATVNVEFGNGIDFNTGIYVGVATTATGAVAPATGLTITTVYR
jgi:hypothetical protein